MPKTKNPHMLKKKERVRATVDMRGVPRGTDGFVLMHVGIDWIRYWVHWDNGVEMGSIHRDKLVRVEEWDQYLVDQEQAKADALLAAEAGEASAVAGGEADAAGGGDGVSVNGVTVPQHLIDKAQAALQRFGVTR